MPGSPNGRHLPAIITTSGNRIPIPERAGLRGYVVGPASVQHDDRDPIWGRQQGDQFNPDEYGTYAATSLPVFAAIRYRAATVGMVPYAIYRDTATGQPETVSLPAFQRLTQLPNGSPYWPWRRLMRFLEWDRCLWGQGFWVLETAGPTGPPKEIWRARPDRMRPVLDPEQYVVGWVYEHMGQRIPFRTDEVVWFPFDNPIDEFVGLSPLAPLRLSVDTAHSAMLSNRAKMANGMRLSAIVSPKDAQDRWLPDEVEAITKTISGLYSGVNNAGRAAVVGGAVGIAPLEMSASDMEYLGQLRWSLNDAARAYGIPPELLGDHEKATYSNVEQAYKGVWTDTHKPELEDIADHMTRQLMPRFGQNVRFAFDLSGVDVLQEDRTEIVDQMAKLWQMGVPLNVLLQEFQPNLLPATNDGYEWGDAPSWEVSAPPAPEMPAGEQMPDDGDMPMDGENPARALLTVLRSQRVMAYDSEEHRRYWARTVRWLDRMERDWVRVMRDLFARQQASVLARLRSKRDANAAESDPFDRAEWEARTTVVTMELYRDNYAEGGADALDQIGITSPFDVTNPRATAWLKARAQRFAVEINETTWMALKDSLAEGADAGESIEELAARVTAIMEDASERRAVVIARTEVIAASNAGGLQAAIDSGVVKGKTWLSALDERVRESHVSAHGQTVSLEGDFTVGSARGPMPGQMGQAKEDIQCRCRATWVLD